MDLHHFFSQQREIERIVRSMDAARALEDAFSPRIAAHLDELHRVAQKISMPPDYLGALADIQRTIDSARINRHFGELRLIHRPTVDAMAALDTSLQELAASVSNRVDSIDSATKVMRHSLLPAAALARVRTLPDGFIGQALRPHRAFADFASPLADAAKLGSAIRASNTMRLVDSAARLLGGMSRVSEIAGLMFVEPPGASALPAVNVFSLLDRGCGAVDLEDPESDIEGAIDRTTSAAVVTHGGQVLDFVFKINRESELSGGAPVFSPSTRTMRAFHVIASHVAQSEESFHEVLDCLFFLLYEGSGNANRLLERVPRERLGALWDLKHLRRDARHDVAHGSASEARKKNLEAGEVFQRLIGKSLPKSSEDWSLAQVKLYRSLADMLDALWAE